MHRLISILLLAAFLGLGSGLLEYLHNLDHAHQDAAIASKQTGESHPAAPNHDDTNCPVHRQLHLPSICAHAVPLLICLGTFVAFLTLLAEQPTLHRPITRLDCRGPPALLSN